MFFEELNDNEWARLAALAADEPMHPHRRGRPRAESRIVANAVLWILTTGERWSKLPARYPSGPTCRRRFDEWLADGTLVDIVKILTEFGRVFAYVPQPQTQAQVQPQSPSPSQSQAQREASARKQANVVATEAPRLRGVFWTNPESWRSASGGASARRNEATSTASAPIPMPIPITMPARAPAPRVLPVSPSTPARETPLVNAASTFEQIDEYCGYTIRAAANSVVREGALMYRASAEVVKDGKRVERSGLIGPRFAQGESATRHALDWAREWIERHAGANAAHVDRAEAADDSAAEREFAAPLSAMAACARTHSREAGRGAGAPDWSGHAQSDGHGDAKPPELLYQA